MPKFHSTALRLRKTATKPAEFGSRNTTTWIYFSNLSRSVCLTPRTASLFDPLFRHQLRVCLLAICSTAPLSTPIIAKSTANRETQRTSQALQTA
jgi:hypothetical protein